MQFLMAGGGTGGHVIPLIAVAQELRERGHEVVFVGTENGIEARLVPAAGFPIEYISIGGLKSVGTMQKLISLRQLMRGTGQQTRRMRTKRPAAVFSMGGYVAGPPVLAALMRRIPLVVMEPNAVPGFTNRRIAPFVSRALIGFEAASRYFPRGKTEVTGVPVREAFFHLAPKPKQDVFSVLITGGSQGSRTLNEAARTSWPLFQQSGLPVRFLHQTGSASFNAIERDFARSGCAGEVTAFINDMPAAFEAADLIVCRSGAGAVAELAAAGKPSILIPFPFAADQHQLRNAEAFEKAGAARLVLDREWTGEKLFEIASALAKQPETLENMGKAARNLARPGAAQRAAQVLEEVARGE
ncbi:MAG: undecaprenyldiphospho-muramoylpentapeptide beta-N-acetylglucosaminyltransferase [Acidobacteriota bacterium]|nr:undecaprenyldiphospho-muramoylpentapeptide beta-N-acetylglucosaminyltransferase [Acidobacteriota bacterium]